MAGVRGFTPCPDFFKLKARATAWGTLGCFSLSVLTVLIFPFVFPSMHSAYFQ
jgi:hypothetical protein